MVILIGFDLYLHLSEYFGPESPHNAVNWFIFNTREEYMNFWSAYWLIALVLAIYIFIRSLIGEDA